MMAREGTNEEAVVDAAVGAKNRAKLIERYFQQQVGSPERPAWQHVYQLLLWIDQTTGLAHCYESDKCQPGKNWYGRSLGFHDWLSRAFDVAPQELGGSLDWLFRHAADDLAGSVLKQARKLLERAESQRKPFDGRGMPQPGEDPELVAIVREVLGTHLKGEVSVEAWRVLVQRLRQYLTLENKRKNLVGEGFEDVIASIIKRAPGGSALDVRTRVPLHDLPGFNRARRGEKPNKVDLAVLRPNGGRRTLVTAKWSVRADREKQFTQEYTDYVNAESDRRPFEYVFVTNEFDPARLMRACEALAGNAPMFTHVVHISPEGLRATYGATPKEESMRKVLEFIDTKRLLGIDQWMTTLVA
jgi:hypothetical protein